MKSSCDHRDAVIVKRFKQEPNRLSKQPHHLWCAKCGSELPLVTQPCGIA